MQAPASAATASILTEHPERGAYLAYDLTHETGRNNQGL